LRSLTALHVTTQRTTGGVRSRRVAAASPHSTGSRQRFPCSIWSASHRSKMR
jgi:hypothetical protein